MKRALAERARGDRGTPSPAKKFARFGGLGGPAGEHNHRSNPWRERVPAVSSSLTETVESTLIRSASGHHPSDNAVAATPTVEMIVHNERTGCGGVGGGVSRGGNSSVPPRQRAQDRSKNLHTSSSQHASMVPESGQTSVVGACLSSAPATGRLSSSSGDGSVLPSPQHHRQQQQPRSSLGTVRSRPSSSSSSVIGLGTSGLHSPPRPLSSVSRLRTRSLPVIPSSNVATPISQPEEEEGGDDEEEGVPSRRYYLQFQNRALVTELHRLRHDLLLLEEERAFRRAECARARNIVEDLNAFWSVLESELAKHVCHHQHQQQQEQKQQVSRVEPQKVELVRPEDRPPSTGEGTDVETVGMLLSSISHLACSHGMHCSIPEEAPSSSSMKVDCHAHHLPQSIDPQKTHDYAGLSTDVLSPLRTRVENLTHLILRFLHRMENGQHEREPSQMRRQSHVMPDISTKNSLGGNINLLRGQVSELALSRDEARRQEKRIRRYLNRILAGQEPSEVLRDVEGLNHMEGDSPDWVKQRSPSRSSTASRKRSRSCSGTTIPGEAGIVSQEDDSCLAETASGASGCEGDSAHKFKMRLRDAESIARTRQQRIDELMKERIELQGRINGLLLDNENGNGDESVARKDCFLSREDLVKRHPMYQELLVKCGSATREAEFLRAEAAAWREKLSSRVGEVDALRKGMEEQRTKFEKRWKEVALANRWQQNFHRILDDSGNGRNRLGALHEERGSAPADRNVADGEFAASDECKVLVLQHKLQQALESARRIEAYRAALTESCGMIETLLAQLIELRAKYQAACTQNRQASQSLFSSSSSSSSTHRSSSSLRDHEGRRGDSGGGGGSCGSSGSGSTDSRLQKDNRRLRKEITALHISRDSNRSKLERLANERDGLVKANSRLLAQSAEKEEINAEALGTILQLKQKLAMLEQEREAGERKEKSVEQLALASRLAANGRDRVVEEDKSALSDLEQRLEEAGKDRCTLYRAMQEKESRVEEAKHQMVALVKDLQAARARCDDLTCESNKVVDEKARVVEELNVSQRQVSDLKKSISSASSSGKGNRISAGGGRDRFCNTKFTAEQLSTQLSVLKGRLACPVCNHRDKSCILLRCRHMFCRQCVDVNIKNRSRKCPACATRFDPSEVGEIWL